MYSSNLEINEHILKNESYKNKRKFNFEDKINNNQNSEKKQN